MSSPQSKLYDNITAYEWIRAKLSLFLMNNRRMTVAIANNNQANPGQFDPVPPEAYIICKALYAQELIDMIFGEGAYQVVPAAAEDLNPAHATRIVMDAALCLMRKPTGPVTLPLDHQVTDASIASAVKLLAQAGYQARLTGDETLGTPRTLEVQAPA